MPAQVIPCDGGVAVSAVAAFGSKTMGWPVASEAVRKASGTAATVVRCSPSAIAWSATATCTAGPCGGRPAGISGKEIAVLFRHQQVHHVQLSDAAAELFPGAELGGQKVGQYVLSDSGTDDLSTETEHIRIVVLNTLVGAV